MTELKTAQEAKSVKIRAIDFQSGRTLATWPETPLSRLSAVRWFRSLEVPNCLRIIQILSAAGYEDASRDDTPHAEPEIEVRSPTVRDCDPLATAEEAKWMRAHDTHDRYFDSVDEDDDEEAADA